MGALFFREIKQLVKGPGFYFFLGLCATIWSLSFFMYFDQFVRESIMANSTGKKYNFHYQVVSEHIDLMHFLILFLVGPITMRLLAEEKKNRTMDLLLTAPISSYQIVMAKFLAGVVAVALLIALGMLFPLSVGFVGDFQYGMFFSSILGLFLVSVLYVSIGLFASAITESLILAVVLTLILNLAVWMLSAGVDLSTNFVLKDFFEFVSIGPRFNDFKMGVLKIESTVFIGSFALFWLFLTERIVESSRWR